MPFFFLSARGEDADRLLGLGLGAADYIVKPFLPRELSLRLTARLRRVYSPPMQEQRPIFRLGEHIVNLGSKMVILRRDRNEFPLTAKELVLLFKLYENRNRIVTSDALCQATSGKKRRSAWLRIYQ